SRTTFDRVAELVDGSLRAASLRPPGPRELARARARVELAALTCLDAAPCRVAHEALRTTVPNLPALPEVARLAASTSALSVQRAALSLAPSRRVTVELHPAGPPPGEPPSRPPGLAGP
ncbi:MAG: hypothetical protein FJ104_15350, partial [Deltaproteobacteria bacterium]|nr:hypothetical protein [Deltaproteobacteria bacterium]